MSKKVFALLGVMALLVALLPSAALAAPKLPDYKPVDVGPELRTWEATQERIAPRADEEDVGVAVAAAPEDYPCYIETKEWLSLDNYNGYYFFTDFYLIAETETSELWVQADLSYPEGDPRDLPVVTCEQAAYLLSEFDGNMYPTETSFFGTPDLHDGTNSLLEAWGYFDPGYFYNEAGRQVVLVSNVRDDAYYEPTYPNYIAGFYSPTFEAYFDRNIMSIDSHDWLNRVGPDGSRPYLYESVFAHEYQHLLHDDYDSDEDTWINEGLSMFAEYLTGYVINEDNYSTFQELPENSLVVWEDQGGREIVADYGMVFLYQMYQYEKFGQAFIQYEFHNPDNGISSINSTLEAFNIQKDFGDIYHDFAVAVLIDSKQANYRYGFKLLDVGIDIGTPADPNPDAYDTPGAPPWGTDYIWLEGKPKDLAKFTFNGVDYTTFPTAWTSDGDALWSGTGDLLDNWAIFETTGGGTLSIDTLWDLEDYWDFAFVQVSTDGGYTWTSLEDNEGYSTYDYDPNAYPTAIANLPGLTSWVPDWVTLSYDLSPYAGQDILVAFRLVTDWATHYGGWWIDAVYMDGVEIFDGSDASIFKDITELLPVNNNFTVTFVGIKGKGKSTQYKVHTMKLDDVTEDGLFELGKVLSWSNQAVMLVTFDAPEGFTGYAEYDYELVYKTKGPKK
jgi:hypothetical protein